MIKKEKPPEYIPKNRCKTENCQNRKIFNGYCLSCYYMANKPLKKKKKK